MLKGVSFRGVTLKNVSFHSGFTLSKKYYLNQSSCR
ncbi:hypothetical protein [Paenibacillus sp. M.A.Huq-84]